MDRPNIENIFGPCHCGGCSARTCVKCYMETCPCIEDKIDELIAYIKYLEEKKNE